MSDKINIEELFRQKFDGFDADVDSSVWEGVRSGIQAAPGTPGAVKGGFTATKYVMIAVAAVAVMATVYLISPDSTIEAKQQTPQTTSQPKQVDVNDPVVLREEKVSSVEANAPSSIITEEENTSERQVANNFAKVPGNSEVSPSNQKEENKITPSAPSTTSKPAETTDQKQPEIARVEIKPHTMDVDLGATSLKDVVQTSITPSPMGGKAPLEVNFSSFAALSRAKWDFGDGSPASSEFSPDYVYTEPGVYLVTLIAEDENGHVFMDRAVVEVHPQSVDKPEQEVISSIKIPNFFTPNGDGTNDYFRVSCTHIDSYTISIYSQSGQIVFQSDSYDTPWDGRDRSGNMLPEGTYFYMITARGEDGLMYAPKAYILLKRSL